MGWIPLCAEQKWVWDVSILSNSMANAKKHRKTIVFSLIGLVLVILTAGAIVKRREPTITVQTEKIGRRNLTEIVVASGKIQPVTQVKISPEVSGEIIELPVKEGQCI